MCKRFEEIAEKALTTPQNTEELIELQNYVKAVNTLSTNSFCHKKRYDQFELEVEFKLELN